MMRTTRFALALCPLLALSMPLVSCGQPETVAVDEHAPAAAEFERGPHNGRLLRDGDFALEITIFEEGVPPEFRMYPYVANEPVDPASVQLSVALGRLGGEVNRFNFSPRQDFLLGNGTVHEPHSFDVTVAAIHGGQRHEWTYASYEGRTTIAREAADAAGVKVEAAGPAEIDEVIPVAGRVELQPQGRSEVRAWYPGRVVQMTKVIGDRVGRGEVIARIESSESLQIYSIQAPMPGVVTERNANVGDVASNQALYVISDATQLHAEFFLYPRDAERARVGQRVDVRNLAGEARTPSTIKALLPAPGLASQTLVAHIELPNTSGTWRPGMAVEGTIAVATRPVPLAVRTRALQRFRDFTVVYIRVGDTYEVRMLELGQQNQDWTEILGGLKPGDEYVSDNAFLIRADVEKSGATHDH